MILVMNLNLKLNPSSPHNSCNVLLVVLDVFERLNKFSAERYVVVPKCPNFTLNAHLHNLQKSLALSTADFLPLLTYFCRRLHTI